MAAENQKLMNSGRSFRTGLFHIVFLSQFLSSFNSFYLNGNEPSHTKRDLYKYTELKPEKDHQAVQSDQGLRICHTYHSTSVLSRLLAMVRFRLNGDV